MATRKDINQQRLRATYQRQEQQTGWNRGWLPSIPATRQEARSICQASILRPARIDGREVHRLSLAERATVLLAFYHGEYVDLHKQCMLSDGSSATENNDLSLTWHKFRGGV